MRENVDSDRLRCYTYICIFQNLSPNWCWWWWHWCVDNSDPLIRGGYPHVHGVGRLHGHRLVAQVQRHLRPAQFQQRVLHQMMNKSFSKNIYYLLVDVLLGFGVQYFLVFRCKDDWRRKAAALCKNYVCLLCKDLKDKLKIDISI